MLQYSKNHNVYIENDSEDTGSYKTEWSYMDDMDFEQEERLENSIEGVDDSASEPKEAMQMKQKSDVDHIASGAPPFSTESVSPEGNRFQPGPGYGYWLVPDSGDIEPDYDDDSD